MNELYSQSDTLTVHEANEDVAQGRELLDAEDLALHNAASMSDTAADPVRLGFANLFIEGCAGPQASSSVSLDLLKGMKAAAESIPGEQKSERADAGNLKIGQRLEELARLLTELQETKKSERDPLVEALAKEILEKKQIPQELKDILRLPPAKDGLDLNKLNDLLKQAGSEMRIVAQPRKFDKEGNISQTYDLVEGDKTHDSITAKRGNVRDKLQLDGDPKDVEALLNRFKVRTERAAERDAVMKNLVDEITKTDKIPQELKDILRLPPAKDGLDLNKLNDLLKQAGSEMRIVAQPRKFDKEGNISQTYDLVEGGKTHDSVTAKLGNYRDKLQPVGDPEQVEKLLKRFKARTDGRR